MKTKHQLTRHFIAIAGAILLVSGTTPLSARQAQTTQQSVQIPPDQLDALVAPIALYPDPLLSQTMVASTYPLEIMQLEQWLQRNPGLKGKALADAVAKQPWDPSVQAMAALPDLVKRLATDIQWTTDLGNAFLAQQSGVMDAVQRMRAKAEQKGTLQSTPQQTVQTEVIDNKSVIVVEPASPDVVYVPSYNPEVVYGPPSYPYPDIYYPSYSGAYAASAISWGVGVAMGAAWGGGWGGWGWNAGWGNNDIDVNWNNNFNRNEFNRADFNRANVSGNRSNWQHNPQHRGGAPYADRGTANRFGSNARGDSLASRQKVAQQQITRQKGNLGSVSGGARPGGVGGVGGARPGGVGGVGGARPGGVGGVGGARPGGVGGVGGARPGGVGGVGGARPGGVGGARPATRPSYGGGDRVGNRGVGSSPSYGNRGGFGGGSGGFSGSAARSSSMRGRSSGGGRSFGGGGGGRRGGGGGGGRRGGGGGRRR